ncbi:MAG: hypothetical protein KDA25_01635 [Phycisphaerales bacterium]|nr:hypothetical protein [Phycisphaerales bacterium]
MDHHARTHVHPADIMDPGQIDAVVDAWPPEWREVFRERAAIMEIDSRNPLVPAMREALKDTVRVAAVRGITLPVPDGR